MAQLTYMDLCSHDELEKAYRSLNGYVMPEGKQAELWELVDALTWDQYQPGSDAEADRTVYAAIQRLLTRKGISADAIKDERLCGLLVALQAQDVEGKGTYKNESCN